MAAVTFFKDPDAVLDFAVNWATWLAADSDTISTSTWTVPTGITEDSESETTTVATIWLSGGTAGVKYDLVNEIVTAGGRTANRTIRIHVMER
jgi:hypothetical protein